MSWWWDTDTPNGYWDELDVVKRMNSNSVHRFAVEWGYKLPQCLMIQGEIVNLTEIERAKLCSWRWANPQDGGNVLYVAHSPENAIALANETVERLVSKNDRYKFHSNRVVKASYSADLSEEYFHKIALPRF